MRALFIAMLAAIALAGCDNLPSIGGRYAAEVGYYQGEKQAWDIWGEFGSLDECRAAAIARFNSYNAQSPGRAFSWACLKKNRDGSYESRHR
jgi:hypothetical protein